MAWDHRSVEGALYGLGRTPEARPVRPSLEPRPPRRPVMVVPGGPAEVRRLDLSFAVSLRLSPAEARIVSEHYIDGAARHPYRARKAIIGRLVDVLNRET